MNRNMKSVIVIILCVAVLGLSIGYAALNSILNITGTAKLGPTASSWNIRFENAKCEASGYATAGTITTEGTNLELSGSILKAPSDAVTCTFDVVNKGTLDAKVISVTEPNKDLFVYYGVSDDTYEEDEAIVKDGLLSEMKYNDSEKTVIQVGDTLNAGETKKLYIKINYRDDMTKLPTSEVEISGIFAEIIYGQAAVGEKETTESDFPELAYKIGSKWQLDPGDGKVRTFYVLEESGDNVSLIMDRNIGGLVAWVSKADYIAAGGTEAEWDIVCNDCGNNNKGPITARNYLNSVTAGWKDVTVSLPTGQQVATAGVDTEWTDSHYTGNVLSNWLYANLYCNVNTCTESVAGDTAGTGTTYGYWTASPIAGISDYAWFVDGDGGLNYGSVDDTVGSDDGAGLRPVITLSKSKLSEIGNISQGGSEEPLPEPE